MEFESICFDGISQILFQLIAFFCCRMKNFRVEMIPPTASILCSVEREVRIADQQIDVRSVIRANSDSDRRADNNALALDGIRLRKRADNIFRQLSQYFGRFSTMQNDLKFVPAQTSHTPLV